MNWKTFRDVVPRYSPGTRVTVPLLQKRHRKECIEGLKLGAPELFHHMPGLLGFIDSQMIHFGRRLPR